MPKEPRETSQEILPRFLTEPDPTRYLGNNYGVLDFETTNLDKGDPSNPGNHIVLAVFKKRGGRPHAYWGSEYDMGALLERIAECDFIVAQGGKFELGWLIRCGARLEDILIYDPVLGAYSEDGNRHTARNLDALAGRYGLRARKSSAVKALIEAGVCPSEIPPAWLEEYCTQDVELTESVFLRQRKLLSKKGLLPLLYSKCLFTPVLAEMEMNGMCLDPERVTETYNEYTREYIKAKQEFDDFTGGVNPRSSTQFPEFVYDRLGFSEPKNWKGDPIRTKAGKRSASAKNLARLTPRTDRQREFLRLHKAQQKLYTAKSKSLDKFKACVDKTDDNILRFQLNQSVTQTHRLSSTGKVFKAQGQNIDNRFKRLFVARKPGYKMGEGDESQLEFRTAVWYGQDERGISDIANGVDAHSFTSHIIFDTPDCDLRQFGDKYKSERHNAKEHTFKPLYGGQSGTDKERAYYAAFREKFPGISATQEGWTHTVLKTGKLKLPTGLTFYWPDTRMSNTGYITNTTNIYNYPVQYLATGEIVPIAVVHQWHRMKALKAKSIPVNTVHDSGIWEVHPDEGELFKKVTVQAYTKDVYQFLKRCYGIDWNVPLDCEVSIATHWSDKD